MVATSTDLRSALLQRKSIPFKSLHNYRSFRPPRTSNHTKSIAAVRRSSLPKEKQLHDPSTAVNSKKSVSFAPFMQIRDLHRTRQDLDNSWYASSEYIDFDRERRDTVAALRHVGGNLNYLDPAIYTIQGLERHLDKRLSYERKLATKQHLYAVLQQQDRRDPEELRAVSEYFSKQVAYQAHMRGVVDYSSSVECVWF